MKSNELKNEYDFSKGERGKFFDKNAVFHIPIYLDPEIESFYRSKAEEQNISLDTMINNLLSKDMKLLEVVDQGA